MQGQHEPPLKQRRAGLASSVHAPQVETTALRAAAASITRRRNELVGFSSFSLSL